MLISASNMSLKLEKFFERQNNAINRLFKYSVNDRHRYNVTQNIVIEIVDKNHIEIRTDAVAYDMFYSPMTSDAPSIFDEFHTKFHVFVDKQGWRAEPRGQGILDLYRDD